MIVAAFDIATATGCCDGAVGAAKPRLWSWYLADDGDDRPQRFLKLSGFLRTYFETQPCSRVVYERPLDIAALAKMHRGDAMVGFLRGAIGVLESICCEYEKPVESISVQDARGDVLGWRINSKKTGIKTKDRVMRDVTKTLRIPAETDNEADAFVIWAHACALLNPRLASTMTPLFRGTP